MGYWLHMNIVIAQWVGYDSTDENHYLTDASSGTASTIFSDVASAILPYTKGTKFTVENAYSQNGYALTYNRWKYNRNIFIKF